MKRCMSSLIGLTLLVGCQSTGEEYEANVYDTSGINSPQEVIPVNIIAILPAQVRIDDSKGRQDAMVTGAVIGGILGTIVGYNTHYSRGYYRGSYYHGGYHGGNIAVLGGIAGTGIGVAVGSSASSGSKLVPGVTIAFSRKDKKGKTYSSTQVGRACLFQMGEAMMITTLRNETRIQPNAVCFSQN